MQIKILSGDDEEGSCRLAGTFCRSFEAMPEPRQPLRITLFPRQTPRIALTSEIKRSSGTSEWVGMVKSRSANS